MAQVCIVGYHALKQGPASSAAVDFASNRQARGGEE